MFVGLANVGAINLASTLFKLIFNRVGDTLDIFFTEYKGMFSWNRPLGGSICFPRMLSVDDTYAFCTKLVQESGIMLAPSRIFDFGDQHVRIGFGREDLPDVLDRFGEYLDERF